MAAGGPPVESVVVPGAGVRLHAVVAGPPGGRPVVLLHGFPEAWYGWRRQIGPLAGAGFRVIAPDQRGYNASDKPARVKDYAIDRLAADVVAVLDGLGLANAAVVGHDWGGAVGWWLGATRPDRVSRLAVLNCPHFGAMARALETDLGQVMRSWYVFAAQLPRAAEWALGRRDFAALVRAMERTSRPGTFTPADFGAYRQGWAQPGALTGMLNWYRASFRPFPPTPRPGRITVPTLLIWGAKDRFLKSTLARASIGSCDAGRLHVFPRASHWVQHEEADAVNDLLAEFLDDEAGGKGPNQRPAPTPL